MILRAAVLVLVAAFQVAASPWTYYRADGRRAVLPAVESGNRIVVRVPGCPRPVFVENRILVRVGARGLPHVRMLALGLEVVRRLRGAGDTWLLAAPDARSALRACRVLVEEQLVIWAVPDFDLPAELHHRPDDPFYPQQWHLDQSEGHDIATEQAWDWTTGDPGIIVAVVDTGVDVDHPDLDAIRMVAPRNEVNDSDDPSPSELAIDAHGTACMGLVTAVMDNQAGVAGVCPDCSWMPVKVFSRGARMQLSALVDGIAWAADEGADIISNSWGISQELIDGGIDVVPVQEAVRYAVETGRGGTGAVVLFAAGNGDGNLNAEPIGPDELPAMSQTIAVGGCDPTGAAAVYSDFGPYVTVVAPTWSGVTGDPRIVTIDPVGDDGFNKGGLYFKADADQGELPTGESEPDAAGNYTGHFSGTSAATPIAAGVAGLVLSVDPALTWQEVRDILQSTAEKVGMDAAGDLRANYDATGHDERYGYGRVHAARAVAVARYGGDQADGAACFLDLNCSGDCVSDPARGQGPVCLSPCEADSECGQDGECDTGYCFTTNILPDGGGENGTRILGGCGCQGSTAPRRPANAWIVILAAGIFLRGRRRSTRQSA